MNYLGKKLDQVLYSLSGGKRHPDPNIRRKQKKAKEAFKQKKKRTFEKAKRKEELRLAKKKGKRAAQKRMALWRILGLYGFTAASEPDPRRACHPQSEPSSGWSEIAGM